MIRFFATRKGLLCFAALAAIVVTAASCAKQSEDVLMAKENNNCDTLNMKFSVNVVPILTANCYECHANGIVNAGVTLDSYAGVEAVVKNGYLVGAITHAPGFVPMPFDGGKLSDCDIAMIQAWIDEGAPND